MNDKLREAAELLGDKVQGLLVHHKGLTIELVFMADKWVASRTDVDEDDGQAVMITHDGATMEEALDAVHEAWAAAEAARDQWIDETVASLRRGA